MDKTAFGKKPGDRIKSSEMGNRCPCVDVAVISRPEVGRRVVVIFGDGEKAVTHANMSLSEAFDMGQKMLEIVAAARGAN